ncbi:hypothetical protein J7438_05635 [Thalassotalea sp. G20_0]|uniref:hypothetical protein n=1 Tax=Thalassotalea sp. G20_0 TaxID=2821093 RepID=UPI001ADB18D3|nr:hypothetical protein [Thalassotalea sp. G20_0]MBO9493567.1 hypothetical protein [Thalassotalea sp. G20_0]
MGMVYKGVEKGRASWFYIVFCWMLLLVFITYNFGLSAKYFNMTPWDGTFQTLFPLIKISFGKYPGVDFFYFHGNGIPYIIYPGYSLLKSLGFGEIVSALYSTFFVNFLFLVFSILALVRLLFDLLESVCITLVLITIFHLIPFSGGYISPLFLGAPMAIRFFPHALMGLMSYYFVRKVSGGINSLRSYLLYGIAGVVGVYLSAEQGFYSFVGGVCSIFLYFVYNKKLMKSVSVSVSLISLFLIFLVISSYLFFGNLETIKVIKTISDDQAWVFGVFPNGFYDDVSEIFSFSIISALPSQIITIFSSALFLVQVAFLILKMMRVEIFVVFSSLFFSALLSWASNIGYIGGHQTALFSRYALLSLLFFLIFFLDKVNANIQKES